jgi:hypothetical protein
MYTSVNTLQKGDYGDGDNDDNDNSNNNNNNNNNIIICTMNNKSRIAATLCTLETWFVSGI